jgi:hypothetical protein
MVPAFPSVWFKTVMAIGIHIKRALFEWGAIGAVSTVVGSLLFWCLSVSPARTDFTLAIGVYGKFSASNGEITMCQFLESWDDIAWEKSNMLSGSTSRAECDMPGLRFWYLGLEGGSRWIASVSLLLPAVVCLILGTFFVWQYRRVRKQLARLPERATVSAPCPLDLPD